jgi:hypothetical protein
MSTRDHSFQNKRKSSRYSVMESSAVMLPFMDVISYRVLDISKSGLSFCNNGIASKSEGSNMAMIFFSAVMNAIGIPVQVICDTELNINHLPADQFASGDFRNPYFRRCGVKFNQLSFEQEESIKLYIQHIEETTDTIPKSG